MWVITDKVNWLILQYETPTCSEDLACGRHPASVVAQASRLQTTLLKTKGCHPEERKAGGWRVEAGGWRIAGYEGEHSSGLWGDFHLQKSSVSITWRRRKDEAHSDNRPRRQRQKQVSV